MAARRFLRPSVVAPTVLAAAVFASVLTVTTRPVETHPRITTALLWAKDIAPILQRRCFTCHSPNNVAMSFTHLWYTCCVRDEDGNGLDFWDMAVVPEYKGEATSKLHADIFRILETTENPEAATALAATSRSRRTRHS